MRLRAEGFSIDGSPLLGNLWVSIWWGGDEDADLGLLGQIGHARQWTTRSFWAVGVDAVLVGGGGTLHCFHTWKVLKGSSNKGFFLGL